MERPKAGSWEVWIEYLEDTGRVIEHWNKLPGEAFMVPSLLVFKKHLDNSLEWNVSLIGCHVWSQEFNSMIFMNPFQIRIFWDSNWKLSAS